MAPLVRKLSATPTRLAISLALLAALVGVLKYGLSMWSGWRIFLDVARNWQDPRTSELLLPPQDYVLPNAGLPALLGALGVTSQTAFVSVFLVLAVAAVFFPFLLSSIRLNPPRSRLLFIVIVGGPVLPLLMNWIGGYDALSIIGVSLAVLSRNRALSASGWLLFGLSHGPIAIVALAAWLVLIAAEKGKLRHHLHSGLVGIAGVVTGILIMEIVTSLWGGYSRRFTFEGGRFRVGSILESIGIESMFELLLISLPVLFFSSLGVLWILLLTPQARVQRHSITLMFLAIGLSVALPMVGYDQTRLVTLALWPAVLQWVLISDRLFTEKVLGRWWRRYAIAGIIVPVPFVTEGVPRLGGLVNLLNWRSSFMG